MRERSNLSSCYPDFSVSAHDAKFLSLSYERVQFCAKRLQVRVLGVFPELLFENKRHFPTLQQLLTGDKTSDIQFR